MKIGDTTLKNGLILAPMAGVTDTVFRTLCFRLGCEYAVTEMVSAKAVCFGDGKTGALARIDPEEGPTALQIFGHEEETMARATALLLEQAAVSGGKLPAAIDINMGCPVKKIVSNGDGSALMRNPDLVFGIVGAVRRETALPVTVKIRSGYSADRINAVEVAQAAQAGGAAMIAVHGRTREQMYGGKADDGILRRVKAAVSVPVCGSGDVYGAADFLRLKTAGCDGVMAARGAMGNPWIFAEMAACAEGRTYVPPGKNERLTLAAEHAARAVALYGEERGIPELRKQMSWYLTGMPGVAAARVRINAAVSLTQLLDILSSLRD